MLEVLKTLLMKLRHRRVTPRRCDSINIVATGKPSGGVSDGSAEAMVQAMQHAPAWQVPLRVREWCFASQSDAAALLIERAHRGDDLTFRFDPEESGYDVLFGDHVVVHVFGSTDTGRLGRGALLGYSMETGEPHYVDPGHLKRDGR